MVSLDYTDVSEVVIWFVKIRRRVGLSVGWSIESVLGLWQFLAYRVIFGGCNNGLA